VAEGGFWKKLTNFFTASEEDEDIIEEDYMDEGYEAEEGTGFVPVQTRAVPVGSTIWFINQVLSPLMWIRAS